MLTLITLSLIPVEKPRKGIVSFISNPNIGVIDTETFTMMDGTQKIHALGFKTNLKDTPVTYYINKDDLDSSRIVLEMIDELLRPKYNKTVFYCHNLAGYDIIFILKIICLYNDNANDKYGIDPLYRNDKIIQVKISKNKNSFTIKDSYAMLPDKLSKLGKNFGVETLKTTFPYEFSVQDNLFYIGETPNQLYYKDTSEEEYKGLYKQDWSFQKETIKYLENDLNSLYQVISKANKQVFNDYGVNLTDSITISGLAVRIFLKDFYKENIPGITKASMYNDIKKAYYGGKTEVYRPHGYNLNYYDINSLYPYVALQDMPGNTCSKVQYYTKDSDINDLFGFFYCYIESPVDSYLGLLPVRDDSGISFPLGKWTGWYFSEELKFAKQNGYKIDVIEWYKFSRESDVFKEYVNKIYSIKSNPINDTQKSMAKSLLNNLLGRFGIGLDKAVTTIVDEKAFEIISSMHKVTSYKVISPQNILVSYVPKLDNDIIKSHGLDIIKLLSKFQDKEIQSLNVSSIAISAAVTAYGRIHMSRIKLQILNEKGKLFYSDTDSIVTDKELDPSMISPNEIGKLKLEHKVDEGIFISGKTYWLYNTKGKVVNKAKGIKSKSLSYIDYMKLLNDNNVDTAIKTTSKIDWDLGYVTINDNEDVTINSDSYKKRDKVRLDGRWIDTKPLVINNIDKSISIYENNFNLITYPGDIYRTFYSYLIKDIQHNSLKDIYCSENNSTNHGTLFLPNLSNTLKTVTPHKFIYLSNLEDIMLKLLLWCIIPISFLGYYTSKYLEEESLEEQYLEEEYLEEELTDDSTIHLPSDTYLDIQESLSEITDFTEIDFSYKTLENNELSFKTQTINDKSIHVENTILDNLSNKMNKELGYDSEIITRMKAIHESEILTKMSTEGLLFESPEDKKKNESMELLLQECFTEKIKRNSQFATFEDLRLFIDTKIEKQNLHDRQKKEVIQNIMDKMDDNVVRLLVEETTSIPSSTSPFSSTSSVSSTMTITSDTTITEQNLSYSLNIYNDNRRNSSNSSDSSHNTVIHNNSIHNGSDSRSDTESITHSISLSGDTPLTKDINTSSNKVSRWEWWTSPFRLTNYNWFSESWIAREYKCWMKRDDIQLVNDTRRIQLNGQIQSNLLEDMKYHKYYKEGIPELFEKHPLSEEQILERQSLLDRYTGLHRDPNNPFDDDSQNGGSLFDDNTDYRTEKTKDFERFIEIADNKHNEWREMEKKALIKDLDDLLRTIKSISSNKEELEANFNKHCDTKELNQLIERVTSLKEQKVIKSIIDSHPETDSKLLSELINNHNEYFAKRLTDWDNTEKKRHLEREQRYLLEDIMIKDKYLNTLKEEDDKSPLSWNLKTQAKFWGHESAFQYFKSQEYISRKKELESRSEIELDIQKSRHYPSNNDKPYDSD
uniref:DNA polymerase n=1 Tax=Coniothyrium glycines TaxID=1077358 RepID=A0A3G4S7P6_9PLEO|nr:DNA polymerase type B [Coniothyrium glycines]AYU74409.1 DNA polymerase type B [Coniothyrium glycines]